MEARTCQIGSNNPAAPHIRAGARSVRVRVKTGFHSDETDLFSIGASSAAKDGPHIHMKSRPPLEEAEMFQTLMTALFLCSDNSDTHTPKIKNKIKNEMRRSSVDAQMTAGMLKKRRKRYAATRICNLKILYCISLRLHSYCLVSDYLPKTSELL